MDDIYKGCEEGRGNALRAQITQIIRINGLAQRRKDAKKGHDLKRCARERQTPKACGSRQGAMRNEVRKQRAVV